MTYEISLLVHRDISWDRLEASAYPTGIYYYMMYY
jgi:hypothetical protein